MARFSPLTALLPLLLALIAALIPALILGTAQAAEPAAQTRALADHLLRAGMPRQAYAELMRQAFAATDPAQALAWERQAGALLWSADRYADAAQHFAALGDVPDARLGLAYSLVHDQHLLPASAVLATLSSPDARYLGAFVALHQHDLPRALQSFDAVPADSGLSAKAQQASAEVRAWGRVPARSPAAAGIFSALLPGSGQAYAGRWGEGVSALVVNGLLAASAVELGRRQAWFGMGLVLVFQTGFYGGNVMSAVNGARRFNRKSWEQRLGPVEDRYGMRLLPGPDGWVAE
ncbi:MAG: hypothetical protein GXP62_11420 [Oligoflexia bacterium]|nr:hypothetical protein [Oligoflexia bacterium]